MPTNLLTMDMDQVHIPDTGMIHMNFFILKIFFINISNTKLHKYHMNIIIDMDILMSMVMPLMVTDTITLTNHIMVQFNMLMATIMVSLQQAKEDLFQVRDLCLIMDQKVII